MSDKPHAGRGVRALPCSCLANGRTARCASGRPAVLLVPMAELPTTGIGPTGIAVTLVPLGALQVLVTTVTLAVFKPWGQTRFQRH